MYRGRIRDRQAPSPQGRLVAVIARQEHVSLDLGPQARNIRPPARHVCCVRCCWELVLANLDVVEQQLLRDTLLPSVLNADASV